MDALRALAALAIVVLHATAAAGALAGGPGAPFYAPYVARLDIGVTVFFLISGFLLYRPFVAARARAGAAPRLRSYARRRALRILPAYWIALTALALYPGLDGFQGGQAAGFYLLAQQFDAGWAEGGLPQAWSLSVEASFYILLPGLAALAALSVRRGPGGGRSGARRELLPVAGLYLVSVVARLGASLAGVGGGLDGPALAPDGALFTVLPGSVYSSLVGTLDWFALGMGLAVASVHLDRGRLVGAVARRPDACWALAAALFLLPTVTGALPAYPDLYGGVQWFVAHALYGVIALLVLLPAVFDHDGGGAVRGFLGMRALAWLGLVSYGIFLWHLPIVVELGTSGLSLPGVPRVLEVLMPGLAITIALAAASYYAVERPLLRRR